MLVAFASIFNKNFYSNMKTIDLHSFRRVNNIKQSELADYLGVSRGFISLVETGASKLPERLVDKLLKNKKGWIVDAVETSAPITIESRVLDTIISQQQTIASLTKLLADASKKESQIAPVEDNAECVDAAGA